MFLTLLTITFVIALIVSFIAVRIFDKPIGNLLSRIIDDDISAAWLKYIKFAIYVVGISGGVKIWQLEKYITPQTKDGVQIILTTDRWILEIYRTIIDTLQSIAWMLLVFFIFALLAYVIVKGFELKKGKDVANAK